MSLNIKNEETCRLAGELACLTGETLTGAITVALRERLAREKRRRDADALARELHAIGQRCAKLLRPGPSSVEHGDLLYDERGLPPFKVEPHAFHFKPGVDADRLNQLADELETKARRSD